MEKVVWRGDTVDASSRMLECYLIPPTMVLASSVNMRTLSVHEA
jgi:hypothetical protein